MKIFIIMCSFLIFIIANASALSTKSETLQDAVALNGNGTVSVITGFTNAIIQVSGSFVATVNFETSIDGINFYSLQCFAVADKTISVTSTTGTGIWRCNIIGLDRLRARISGYSSGSVTVKAEYNSVGIF